MLDAQEYLHLGIKSSQNGMHQAALEQLHGCLLIDPDNAVATFLLAAEHAELGLYERAVTGMERALLLDPNLDIAMLQLGMLYVQCDDSEKAINLWNRLKHSTKETSLKLFADGLSLLCQDKTMQAIKLLQDGIEANNANPALNASITNIIDGALKMPKEGAHNEDEPADSLYIGEYSNNAMGDD